MITLLLPEQYTQSSPSCLFLLVLGICCVLSDEHSLRKELRVVFGIANPERHDPSSSHAMEPVYPGENYWLGVNCAVQLIAGSVGFPEEGVAIIEI